MSPDCADTIRVRIEPRCFARESDEDGMSMVVARISGDLETELGVPRGRDWFVVAKFSWGVGLVAIDELTATLDHYHCAVIEPDDFRDHVMPWWTARVPHWAAAKMRAVCVSLKGE